MNPTAFKKIWGLNAAGRYGAPGPPSPVSFRKEKSVSRKEQLSPAEKKRRKGRTRLIWKTILLAVLLVILLGMIWLASGGMEKLEQMGFWGNSPENSQEFQEPEETPAPETEGGSSETGNYDKETALEEAEKLAVQYDYDGALEILNSVKGADQDADLSSRIAEYELQKTNLVPTSPQAVTHVFFHSLVVDPERGFAHPEDPLTAGFCQWMTTVDEFNAMLEQMYARGYVLVDLHDLAEKTTDANGAVHLTPKEILLPPGKIPFVLSLDDLSYYHSYDGRGIASKMVLDEEGKPTCEYITPEGETVTGSYDCVPLLDDFLEEHPDFSYKGAKGTIALTGYNGILGYRTDSDYKNRRDLSADQAAWLEAHPDFDWEKECEEAKKVAEAIKADGWNFASHTWGHIKVGEECSLERLQTDTERWLQEVAPLIGGTDTIIFAHGQDLAAWNEDYGASAKVQYLQSKGFDFFCNVDSTQYFVQMGDNYLRMGRRNLDGYRLWEAVYGGNDKLSDLFNASEVIDPKRPTDPALYAL